MTRSELATFITTKLSLTDAASVSFCKDAINRRYQMIWDSYLWTESLGISEYNFLAGESEISLSNYCSISYNHRAVTPSTKLDFPVAVRVTPDSNTDDAYESIAADWVGFFQIDPNVWVDSSSRRGTPRNFINLPSSNDGSPRIKLVPVPTEGGTLFALGKVKLEALTDSGTPALRGIDSALLAYVEGDMLERARQYGKAQAKYAEGAAHVQTMRDIERNQMAGSQRIIPSPDQSYDPICAPD